jgi:hypothetical protein
MVQTIRSCRRGWYRAWIPGRYEFEQWRVPTISPGCWRRRQITCI